LFERNSLAAAFSFEVQSVIPNRLRLATLLAVPFALSAQSPCHTHHLTIFDANLAEFLEERTLNLQSGSNAIEWRGIMPQTYVRTIRVTVGDGIIITRQDVTYDGPEVRNQKSPVLHLTVQNAGVSGPHKVQIDYLAPGLSWRGDYSLLLAQPVTSDSRSEMELDSWVTVQNDTGADICADSVDLVAGEVQLLLPGAGSSRTFTATSQVASPGSGVTVAGNDAAEVTSMSVFSRLRLGRNVAMAANVSNCRFPRFQRLKLPVETRYIFESEAAAQTLGRGGFMLSPRGLETRLVSRNNSKAPLPAGLVTSYSLDNEVPQIVGQDQIPLTPVGADFSITQGRSNLIRGTRRVIDRKTVSDASAINRTKLVTQVEIVVVNGGPKPAPAFIREAIEGYGREWSVTESTHPHQKLGDRMIEFQFSVPANASISLVYTVESR
jgi:hypothetical protein